MSTSLFADSVVKDRFAAIGIRLVAALLLSATASFPVFAQSPASDSRGESASGTPAASATSAKPVEQRVSGIALLVAEGNPSIRQCHALPGQLQGLDFSAQARAVVDRFIANDSRWDGTGDFPVFYLDGWARFDGNGNVLMQRVEAISLEEKWCNADIFVGGGNEPPWSVSLQADHIHLEVGYPGAEDYPGDRRRYDADAQITMLDNGGYRWLSASPAMTVTVEPEYCPAGMRDGDVKMWAVKVTLPEEDPVSSLMECGTRGGAPLPHGVAP